jgi:uncharacterized glyoxalase superfamily protein PhnB
MSEPQPTFFGVHLTVGDLSRSADFYRLVGLTLPPPDELADHLEIDLGAGVHLALSTEAIARMYDVGWRTPSGQTAAALQFLLPSRPAVDLLYQRLVDAGHSGHLAPVDAFWGGRYAEVDDPDGNIVGFHSPRRAE